MYYEIQALYGPTGKEGIQKGVETTEGSAINAMGNVAGQVQFHGSNESDITGKAGVTWQQGQLSYILPVLPGNNTTDIHGLTDSGDAIGYRYDKSLSGSGRIPVLIQNGSIKDLRSRFGEDSSVTGINNAGLVCGYGGKFDKPVGFIYDSKTDKDPIQLSYPPLAPGEKPDEWSIYKPALINEKGEVIGVDENKTILYTLTTGKFVDLKLEMETSASAIDLNEVGQICGSVTTKEDEETLFTYDHPCLWDINQSPLSFTEIPFPPAPLNGDPFMNGVANCINNQGIIAGTCWGDHSEVSNFETWAFIYMNGASTLLDTLLIPNTGWHLSAALDINEQGQITGYGYLGNRKTGFVLTPKPDSPPVPDPEPEEFPLYNISITIDPMLVGKIFGGVAVDGGGIILLPGGPKPVGPWEPYVRFTAEKKDVLLGLVLDEMAKYIIDPKAQQVVRRSTSALAEGRIDRLNDVPNVGKLVASLFRAIFRFFGLIR